ncbi:MAG: FAD-dependent oxidoreductase [Candidatus Ratteibacteria bacterium]|jgi:hypothetical protein
MSTQQKKWKSSSQVADVCVVGAGIAGICAAIAAARHNVSVILVHDRPVPGGASSSESRMHICGADRHNHLPFLRETGILEELQLSNLQQNPFRNHSIWDTVLYNTLVTQPNLSFHLNTSCMEASLTSDGSTIKEISCLQLTTNTILQISARTFIDASGDGVLAPLSGALFRQGREGKKEFNEPQAPDIPDNKTMGNSVLFAAKDTQIPCSFSPPSWAYSFPHEEDLPFGAPGHSHLDMGYWWIETGGEEDTIADAESIRHELLRILFGVWDHIKNHCIYKDRASTWTLDWIQFLPTKRESRRYIGDHILTENDILSCQPFEDIVAYGGWSLDDHQPGGFHDKDFKKIPNPNDEKYLTPSPYAIPFRSLYSRNINNLMCAGRCISCTHRALSSTRVMGTCAAIGQTTGTAAALAIHANCLPRKYGTKHIHDLQQTLLLDDCWLPGKTLEMADFVKKADLLASEGDPETLRDGINRPVDNISHRWQCDPGGSVEYQFQKTSFIKEVILIFDSSLDKLITMSKLQPDNQLTVPPDTLCKSFRLETSISGKKVLLFAENNNYQRFVRIPLHTSLSTLTLTLLASRGDDTIKLYGFYPL